jgi:hypothetical protein
MTSNMTVQMPGGNVAFDVAVGRDRTPWKGYTTDLPGLLVARLPSYDTVPLGERKATYRPATTWGIFHLGTGMRLLWFSYRTRREATRWTNALHELDWSGQTWPEVTEEQLVRILIPTPEQELQDRVAELECQLRETREAMHEVAGALREAHAELAAVQGKERYVVVNTTCGPFYREPGECFVMPGEDTHTFSSIERAAHCVLDAVLEGGHDLDSARIYRLAQVPKRAVQEALFAAVREREEEVAERYPDGDAPLWLSLPPACQGPTPACARCPRCPACGHRDEPDDAPGSECAGARAATGGDKMPETAPWSSRSAPSPGRPRTRKQAASQASGSTHL